MHGRFIEAINQCEINNKVDKVMYVVKKAGKCLSEKGSFPSIVGRLPTAQ